VAALSGRGERRAIMLTTGASGIGDAIVRQQA
jgi:hypothetical protein